MKRRLIWLIAAGLLCAAFVASCGRGGGGSKPAPSSDWGEMVWGTGTWSD